MGLPQENAVECGPYDYTRSGNPTRHMLEHQLADIEVSAYSARATSHPPGLLCGHV